MLFLEASSSLAGTDCLTVSTLPGGGTPKVKRMSPQQTFWAISHTYGNPSQSPCFLGLSPAPYPKEAIQSNSDPIPLERGHYQTWPVPVLPGALARVIKQRCSVFSPNFISDNDNVGLELPSCCQVAREDLGIKPSNDKQDRRVLVALLDEPRLKPKSQRRGRAKESSG